jgi:CheY-like chemotaxis protein
MAHERIAVVNHDPTFLRLMELFLEHVGYHAMTFHGAGGDTLDFICECKPDLLILDIWLKEQDEGWNIIQLMRMEPGTQHIPIIVCSTDSQNLGAKSSLLQTLNCEVLEKPFDLAVLQNKIERGLATLSGSDGGHHA